MRINDQLLLNVYMQKGIGDTHTVAVINPEAGSGLTTLHSDLPDRPHEQVVICTQN